MNAERSGDRWWDLANCSRIFEALRMSANPLKLGLALAALAFSYLLGATLDRAWIWADQGEHEPGTVLVRPATEPPDQAEDAPDASPEAHGIFALWWGNQRSAALGGLVAILRLNALGSPPALSQALTDVAEGGPWLTAGLSSDEVGRRYGLAGCVALMVRGLAWMVMRHPLYAVLFFGPSLAVWSLFCGTICRLNAFYCARGERLEFGRAWSFVRARWLSGFTRAPLLPVMFAGAMSVLLLLGGLLFSIPWVGDLLGGLLFGLGGVIGVLAALCLVVSGVAVHLYWPAMAVDGYSPVESVLHTSSYIQDRPVRTLWYALVSTVYSGLCWLLVLAVVGLGLRIMHSSSGFSSGWVTDRALKAQAPDAGDTADESQAAAGRAAQNGSKLDAVWSIGGVTRWFQPSAYEPHTGDKLSRALVAGWVYLALGLMSGLAVNLWLACSTIVYFLLRQNVDAVDWSTLYTEPGDGPGLTDPDIPAARYVTVEAPGVTPQVLPGPGPAGG